MPIRFTAGLDNESKAQFDRAFLKVESTLSDFRPVFDDYASEFWYPMMEGQFHSAGAAGGQAWEPLSEAYSEWKAAHSQYGSFVDISILRLTDHMYWSLVKQGADGNVDRREKLFAEFGTTDPKARRHQYGGGRLPARELIVMNAARLQRSQKVLQKSLVNQMRDTGLVQRTLEF